MPQNATKSPPLHMWGLRVFKSIIILIIKEIYIAHIRKKIKLSTL